MSRVHLGQLIIFDVEQVQRYNDDLCFYGLPAVYMLMWIIAAKEKKKQTTRVFN